MRPLLRQHSLPQAQKNRLDAQAGNRPQQPAQVVAGSTAEGMQRIAHRALQPATIHAVIRFQVTNGGLNCLAPTQPAFVLCAHTLELAPVNDLFVRVVGVHPTKPQIGVL